VLLRLVGGKACNRQRTLPVASRFYVAAVNCPGHLASSSLVHLGVSVGTLHSYCSPPGGLCALEDKMTR
jgi:hypothetical protein